MEKIGKVLLDDTYYPGEDYYCDGAVEEELLEIVREHRPAEFPRVIEERESWPILYHLSSMRENIVSWLPIDKGCKVLEVGSGCGAVTGCLCRKAGSVTGVDLSRKRSRINAYRHADCENLTLLLGNFTEVEPALPADYDYIFLIGVLEYGKCYIGTDTPFADFLKLLQKHLKPGGRIVIAIENRWGLKYWAGCREDHLGTFFSGLEDYQDGGDVRTFTRRGLEEIFDACGAQERHFYYPYPDYKFMETLYSDDRLPERGELTRNLRNFDRDRLLLFDEKRVFDSVLREGLFPLYSNSYLAVLGPGFPVYYSKFSNDRAAEFAIRTDFRLEEGGVPVAEKHPLTKEAAGHIENIGLAYESLRERFDGSGLHIGPCELIWENNLSRAAEGGGGQESPFPNEGGSAVQEPLFPNGKGSAIQEPLFPGGKGSVVQKASCPAAEGNTKQEPVYARLEYIEGRTLEELLDGCLEREDFAGFHALFDKYFAFLQYRCELPVVDYDLIFSNILVNRDSWTVIDYEWTFGKCKEPREIAFRALYCYVLADSRREKLGFSDYLEELGIGEGLLREYREEEMAFQKYVTGERLSLGEIRERIDNPVYDAAALLKGKRGTAQEERIQIYEDRGEGFREADSFFPEEGELERDPQEPGLVTFHCSVKPSVKALRLDPCMCSALVWLREVTLDGRPLERKGKAFASNGRAVGEGVFAFATQDPGFTFVLGKEGRETAAVLRVTMEVTKVSEQTAALLTARKRG